MVYFLTAAFVVMLSGFNFERARHTLTKIIAVTCQCGLWIFNIRVIRDNIKPLPENYLLVSNHLSYVDVLVLSSLFRTSFVTSHEMRKTPFLGQLCQFGGCLFVDRKNRRGLSAEVEELAKTLRQNVPVTIFPEATSTNGEAVRPFRKPLFQAALMANVKVLPVCLNYERLDGEKISLKNRDSVFWYGDFPFFGHALKLFAADELIVRVTAFHLINVENKDKYQLTSEVQNLIESRYRQVRA